MASPSKEVRAAAQRRRVQRNIWFIQAYLETHPCVDCGETNPIVMEFDHVTSDKQEDISRMVYSGRSLASIQAEVAKCEVRCANCHRIATHRRRRGIEDLCDGEWLSAWWD